MSVLAPLGTVSVGAVLGFAGLLKLLRPQPAARAPTPAGWAGLGAHPTALRALGALEFATGLGVLELGAPALFCAAALLWSFSVWSWLEVARGHRGAPCPCFGGRTAIGPRSGAVTLVFASLASALAATGASGLTAVESLALVCGLLAIVSLILAAVAFLLAREVASLRTQLHRTPPPTALEILDEGPPVGRESPLIERFSSAQEGLALAVFLSPGCTICRELQPSIELLAAQPGLELIVFDEQRDQLAWHSAAIPGSPYAVAMTSQGAVLAKGTFNTPEQLASIPATATERLRAGLAYV